MPNRVNHSSQSMPVVIELGPPLDLDAASVANRERLEKEAFKAQSILPDVHNKIDSMSNASSAAHPTVSFKARISQTLSSFIDFIQSKVCSIWNFLFSRVKS